MAWQDKASNVLLGGFQGGATGATIAQMMSMSGNPWLIGAGVGIGILQGILSPTEEADLARRYARGEIDPDTQDRIVQALAGRYDTMRQEQGSDFARRGMLESSMASRMMSDSYASERDALAKALAGQSSQNQELGLDMLAKRAQETQAGWASGANALGQLALMNKYGTDDPTPTPAAPAAPSNPTNPAAPLPTNPTKPITSATGGGSPLVRGVSNAGGRQRTVNTNPNLSLWRPSAIQSNLAPRLPF